MYFLNLLLNCKELAKKIIFPSSSSGPRESKEQRFAQLTWLCNKQVTRSSEWEEPAGWLCDRHLETLAF